MRQISDEGRREIAKELREQFYCCWHAEEFTEGLYDVLDLGHCEPTHGGYPDLAERLADYVEPAPVTGSTSDGYHTFDELYHHRAVLFSVVVAMFRGCSWKSLHHHDGTMYRSSGSSWIPAWSSTSQSTARAERPSAPT